MRVILSLSQRERVGEREKAWLLQKDIPTFSPSSGLAATFSLREKGSSKRAWPSASLSSLVTEN